MLHRESESEAQRLERLTAGQQREADRNVWTGQQREAE